MRFSPDCAESAQKFGGWDSLGSLQVRGERLAARPRTAGSFAQCLILKCLFPGLD